MEEIFNIYTYLSHSICQNSYAQVQRARLFLLSILLISWFHILFSQLNNSGQCYSNISLILYFFYQVFRIFIILGSSIWYKSIYLCTQWSFLFTPLSSIKEFVGSRLISAFHEDLKLMINWTFTIIFLCILIQKVC